MKFRVNMKTPDALEMAVVSAVECALQDMGIPEGDEKEDRRQGMTDEANAVATPYFLYGERLTVEVDTEAKTVVLVKAGR